MTINSAIEGLQSRDRVVFPAVREIPWTPYLGPDSVRVVELQDRVEVA